MFSGIMEYLHIHYVILWKCPRDDVRSEVFKHTTVKIPPSVCKLTGLQKCLNLLTPCCPPDSRFISYKTAVLEG